MGEAARRIADAGDSFDHTARAIASSLEQTMLSITARVSGEAEAATRRMTEELANAIVAVREFAERNRSVGDEATRTMAGLICEAAAGFERSAAQVAEALAIGAGDAAARLTAAVEALGNHFTRLTSDLTGNLETAGSQFARQGREGATALAEAAQAAASALKAGGQESGDALRSGGADASRELQVATGGLAGPTRELGQRVIALRSEALELQRSLESTRQASIEATTVLRSAASGLIKVGASGQEMTADLATAQHRRLHGDELAEASMFFDALEGAMEINEQTPGG
jgi:hypothetical protein